MDEKLQEIIEQQPDDEILYDLAELFKIFGDSTRIKILYVLSENELCVNDIAQVLNMTQSSVSHQLRILKDSKLVRFRREGKSIFYALDDEHVRNIIDEFHCSLEKAMDILKLTEKERQEIMPYFQA